ncbi:flagellar biosynthesis protein FlgD [Buchnera aphidicola (Macrosiphoniella sanborni)]|uniref:Basal-body rod modification protein FlgD n=1 Tax=Buchnera aphidicola (Macrosiphoniella sanborni) TaxID=1241865 RepID=A0A4D6Y6I9_9GAMM|nr:flagellar hook capping FlgD N-terminal domain-containing protein [Buchnera aphidicola]QCI24103.1 flagellar biosynthesis protein FlgD [Buchnera aphidicola (Macrosiphoniella sanborni)]
MSTISTDINKNDINIEILKNNDNTFQKDPDPLNLQKNFLNLLLTQIQNQDPTNPLKNTELTSQLALINTASGILQLNNTVSNLSNQIHKNQAIQLTSLIGHRVMIPSDEIIHTKNTKTNFGLELFADTDEIEIKILDKNQKVLHHNKIIKKMKPGIHTFSWDGEDLNHKIMETGKYYITVSAKNQDKSVPISTLSESIVHSIIISSSADPIIDLGPAGQTTLSHIREILTSQQKQQQQQQ